MCSAALTVCVTREWAGFDTVHYSGKCSRTDSSLSNDTNPTCRVHALLGNAKRKNIFICLATQYHTT